jgi:hypothetical protein
MSVQDGIDLGSLGNLINRLSGSIFAPSPADEEPSGAEQHASPGAADEPAESPVVVGEHGFRVVDVTDDGGEDRRTDDGFRVEVPWDPIIPSSADRPAALQIDLAELGSSAAAPKTLPGELQLVSGGSSVRFADMADSARDASAADASTPRGSSSFVSSRGSSFRSSNFDAALDTSEKVFAEVRRGRSGRASPPHRPPPHLADAVRARVPPLVLFVAARAARCRSC